MNLTTAQLIIFVLVVSFLVLSVLYSIVITVLFVHKQIEYIRLEKEYNRLGERADKVITELKETVKSEKENKKITIGFIAPEIS